MNPLQLLAITILTVALGWGLRTWVRMRDWRLALIVIVMPALALFHAVLVLWRTGIWPLTFAITPLQFTASAMAVLISLAVALVSQLVQRLQQAVARSTESEER